MSLSLEVVHSLQNSKPFKNLSKNSGSKDTIQLYFDFSKGVGLDINCNSIGYTANFFNMRIITE